MPANIHSCTYVLVSDGEFATVIACAASCFQEHEYVQAIILC